MLQLRSLKVFISQRLTEAVEEVIGRLERTITEYEEEMERRHQRQLDAASKPEDEQRRAGPSHSGSRCFLSGGRSGANVASLLAPVTL